MIAAFRDEKKNDDRLTRRRDKSLLPTANCELPTTPASKARGAVFLRVRKVQAMHRSAAMMPPRLPKINELGAMCNCKSVVPTAPTHQVLSPYINNQANK